jgi:hypothetical protein
LLALPVGNQVILVTFVTQQNYYFTSGNFLSLILPPDFSGFASVVRLSWWGLFHFRPFDFASPIFVGFAVIGFRPAGGKRHPIADLAS